MFCSNCGKNIPFAGRVCPWCHRQKASDQAVRVIGLLGAFTGGGLGFLLGALFGSGTVGFVAGALLGGFFATGLTLIVPRMAATTDEYRRASEKLRKAIDFAKDSGTTTTPSASTDSRTELGTLSRLETLEALKARGTISESEFDEKRRQILSDL